jgi:hypothetical protein
MVSFWPEASRPGQGSARDRERTRAHRETVPGDQHGIRRIEAPDKRDYANAGGSGACEWRL